MSSQPDLDLAVEKLLPGAIYGTARKTDVDADDYSALERTWGDLRPMPSLSALISAWQTIEAENNAETVRKTARRIELSTALQDEVTIPTTAEIAAIGNLQDAKAILLRMRALLRINKAILDVLRHDRKLLNSDDR